MVLHSWHQFFWVGSQITCTYTGCFKFKPSCSVSCSYHAITSSVLTIAIRCRLRRPLLFRLQTSMQVDPIFHLIFEPQNWFSHAHLCHVQRERGSRMVRWISDKTWFWSADAGYHAAEAEPQAHSRAFATRPSLCLQQVTKQSAWRHHSNATHLHAFSRISNGASWGRSGLSTPVCTNFYPFSPAPSAQASRMLNESLTVGSHLPNLKGKLM